MSPLLSWDVDPLRSKACHIGWNATPWSHTRSHQLGNRSGCLRSMEIFASVFFSRFFGWDSESQFERQMPETLANLFCEEMMFLFHILYTYTYTLGAGGSPGTPAPRGFIYMKLGWGGVRMVTFLELAHMVGATQVMGLGWGWGGDDNVPCTCTHGRCYALRKSWDWGGVGWGWFRSLNLHTWSVLRKSWDWGGVGVGMITFLALAHMVGATQVMGLGWGGVGMISFLELAHMVVATQVMGLGWGWGGDDNVPCTCTHGRCYASHGIGVGLGWGW